MVVLYLPLVFIGSKFYGMKGVFYAGAVSNLVAGVVGFYFIRSAIRSHDVS